MAVTYGIALERDINENIQPPVGCETLTQYSAILFVNLGEYEFYAISGADPGFLERGFRCIKARFDLLILPHFS